MRKFAWGCVVAGILIAALGPIVVKMEYESRWTQDNMQRLALRMKSPLSDPPLAKPWVLVGVGAGISAFGVLLLAVRPPNPKPEEPNK